MNSRQRVIKAFNFEKPDRVPRYEIFLGDYAQKWNAARNPGADSSDCAAIYDYYDRIDIGTVLTDQEGPFFRMKRVERREGPVYYERDSWGRLLLKKEGAFFEKELENILDSRDALDSLTFEPPLLEERVNMIRDQCRRAPRRFAPVSGVLGLFMGCSRLRGDVNFLVDMAEDAGFAAALAQRLAEFTEELGWNLAELTDTKDTALWVYDEFSSRTGPLFSPALFERIFLPCYKKMISAWKAGGIQHVVLHCDGNCMPLLDMIVEAGFTGLQGLAPTAGMWLPDIKRKYGNKLVLVGGMCNIETLAHGTQDEIERQALAIAEAAKEGGVVIGTHSIDVDIPFENYDFYYSVVNRCDERW